MSYFDVSVIRNVHLFGIDLVDEHGNEFPDSLLQTYLDSAVAEVEKKLNICIYPRDLVEEHDYRVSDYLQWGYLQLNKKPVMEIYSLEMVYGNSTMFKIPNDWIKIDRLTGQLQLFPTTGSAGGLIIGRNGLLLPLMRGYYDYAPKMWKVSYRAGMNKPSDDNKENQVYDPVLDIHPDLEELIYKRAAANVAQVWGDLIIGAGIASESVSIDGISQTINTTQSAMYSGAGARIELLKKDCKRLFRYLYRYYNGPGLISL